MNEFPKVKVSGAPDWEDFEGELIMQFPAVDGRMMCMVGWGKGDPLELDVFSSEYVTIIEEGEDE